MNLRGKFPVAVALIFSSLLKLWIILSGCQFNDIIQNWRFPVRYTMCRLKVSIRILEQLINLSAISNKFADIGKPGQWENDSGILKALDFLTEWFHDRETKTHYFWTPDGSNPESHEIEFKSRDWGFEVNNLNEIHLIGFIFLDARSSLRVLCIVW